uniref:SLIT and NTRK like family member 3 n=1 Tax=Apteryx owenii TaxID=8824 RepID=A0A8B9Q8H7_APTOW
MLSDSEVEASLGIPQLPSSKENAWPTKPSSMLSSFHFTASSVEYKTSNKQPKPTKQPRAPRPPPTSRGLYPGPNQPPIAAYQTRPPIPIICPTGCSCSLHINDLGLTVNCKERGFHNISELLPRPLNAKKLYLSGNLIQKIYRSDFWNFSSLDLLHLGNNRISYVQDGAFINLPNLKSLYLNGNDIERLTPGMFRGLQSLHYLYFEYNLIREIQPAAFSLMPNLKLLFLNDNLLRTLPTDAFAGTSLARLNLRNNHFLALPVAGVLEHLHKYLIYMYEYMIYIYISYTPHIYLSYIYISPNIYISEYRYIICLTGIVLSGLYPGDLQNVSAALKKVPPLLRALLLVVVRRLRSACTFSERGRAGFCAQCGVASDPVSLPSSCVTT